MIANLRYLSLLSLITLFFSSADGQVDTMALKKFVIPLNRQLYNGYVDQEQKNILRYDGKPDNQLNLSSNQEVNLLLTQAATIKIDWLQYKIEKDSLLNHNKKVRYVQGLKLLLQNIQQGWRYGQLNPFRLPPTIDAFDSCYQMDKKDQSIEDYIRTIDYNLAYPLVRCVAFDNNPGIKNARYEVIRKYCLLFPAKTFATLRENPDVPFADTLVKTVARRYPRQLYDYAASGDKFGYIIRNINDDIFIKSIVRMARSKSGQQYFPFLDNIVKGKMTFEQIDSVKEDSLKYYRLLVKTQLDYVQRAINKDTAFEFRALTEKLAQRAKESFVNVINGLHTEKPDVRFACIQPLSAEELYYLAVLTDGTIYTSSFVKGVYPLMMQRINNRGDSLLVAVHFDKYRRLIKMAAGYNTLGNFLSSFPKSTKPDEDDPAIILMKAFVKGLERSSGYEEAVDVADSYASIQETLKPIADKMLLNVKENYKRNASADNKRGTVIYNILDKLFLSADTAQNIDLTKELGIPPVYEVPYKSLVNDSGKVIMQVFFYGDKDGQGIFKGFLNTFTNANWKITGNEQWVSITSTKGKPVAIYANRPLAEEGGEDEQAQKALGEYLKKNRLYPVVTIHRGHSYTAPSTIEQMANSSKIVFLGSCGGYLIIHSVLEKAPDAHIIATKQIGDTRVNRPFFQLISEKVRNGNNIDWIPFWKELKLMAQSEDFDDYIPPYKNLGALFIKAFKIAMDE